MMKRNLAAVGFVAAALSVLAGCPQGGLPPIFTPGQSGRVGTLDDRIGNLFDIALTDDGEIEVIATGEEGNASFIIDDQGRLSAAEGENGTDVDLSYNEDGTVDVVGTFVNGSDATPFEGTIPAGLLPTGKRLNAQTIDADICAIITEFCGVWPELFDAILSAGFDQLGDLNLPNGEVFEFPTGNNTIDNVIRNVLRQRLALLYQIDAFCNAWSEVDQDQICD